MYQVDLAESYFPPQHDAVMRNITVGGFLIEIADKYPKNIALTFLI